MTFAPPDSIDALLDVRASAEARAWKPSTVEGGASRSKSGRPVTITAADLEAMAFPPVRPVAGPFLRGLTLWAGREKIGKSWGALDLALGVASGERVFGEWAPDEGAVLYLALEDNFRRLKGRLAKLLPTGGAPAALTFRTEAPRLGEGLEEVVREWHAAADRPRLVILDTFQHVRPPRKQGGYGADTDDMAALKRIGDDLDLAFVVVHHLRKAISEGEPFDEVSGTTGLAGAADSILVMKRDPSGKAILYGRGRDLQEQELALDFDKPTCRWSVLGDADDALRTDERDAILGALLDLPGGEGSPRDVADLLDGVSYEAVRQLLSRMARDCEVIRPARGRYRHPDAPGAA